MEQGSCYMFCHFNFLKLVCYYRFGNTLRFPGAADEPPACYRTAVSHLGLSSPRSLRVFPTLG